MKHAFALLLALLCGCSALIPAESVSSPRELALVIPRFQGPTGADWNRWGAR
jgi:hypothetical protein